MTSPTGHAVATSTSESLVDLPQSRPTTPPPDTAAHRTVRIAELLHLILSHVELATLLTTCQRVCREWRGTIKNDSALQRRLFFRPSWTPADFATARVEGPAAAAGGEAAGEAAEGEAADAGEGDEQTLMEGASEATSDQLQFILSQNPFLWRVLAYLRRVHYLRRMSRADPASGYVAHLFFLYDPESDRLPDSDSNSGWFPPPGQDLLPPVPPRTGDYSPSCEAFQRPEASWRRMMPFDAPAQTLRLPRVYRRAVGESVDAEWCMQEGLRRFEEKARKGSRENGILLGDVAEMQVVFTDFGARERALMRGMGVLAVR
jgi:hypothetical protein